VTAPLRQALLAVTLVLALAVVCAVAWTPRPRAETPPSPPVRSSAPTPPAENSGGRPDPLPERNVFEFVDPRPVAPAPVALPPLMVPPPLAPLALAPSSEPIRLVGFVRRGGTLRAALSIEGSVSVLAVGEAAGGYSLVSLDEDAGVTLRTPDGAELLLPPPEP
jgi:hypothetical protein